MTNKQPPFIQTYLGHHLDLLNPHPTQIDIVDINAGLSNQARFNGHTKEFYSVAQHSVAVSQLLSYAGYDTRTQLLGLLHDAPEAYLGDMVSPLKCLIPEFKAVERRVWEAVAARYELPTAAHTAVEWADEEVLMIEAAQFLPGGPQGWGRPPRLNADETPRILSRCLSNWEAAGAFSDHFDRLTADLDAEAQATTTPTAIGVKQ